MKKASLLLGLLASTFAVSAQVTWFSQTVGLNTSGASVGITTGYSSVRLDNGHFIGVGVSDGSGLQLKEFDVDGTLLSTHELAGADIGWNKVNGVELIANGNAVVVSGLGMRSGFTSQFLIARIDLNTFTVNMIAKDNQYFAYTAGPDLSVTNDAVYVIYPEFSKLQAAKFDHNLAPVWNRCMDPRGDTLGGKFPSMGGTRCDSGIVVTCKDDSSYGHSRMGEDGSMLNYTVYRGPGYVRVYNVTAATDGNVFISGLYSPYYASAMDSRPLIGKMTPSGDVLWVKVLDKYNPSPSMRRFVDVVEGDDGRIYAFGSLDEAYNDSYFDGVCVFDAAGNLLLAKRFGTATSSFQLYDAKFYNDGILLAGTYYTTTEISNVMIFTNRNFDQVCESMVITMTNEDHDLGPKETLDNSTLNVWNGSTNAIAPVTLNASADAQPVSCSKVVGTEDASNVNTVLYPNPATSGMEVRINLSQAGEYSLTVVDMTGKTLAVSKVSGSTATVSTSQFAPGIYMVNIQDATGNVSSQKLIIQ